MPVNERELYKSANGDRWCLVRDSRSGQVFVKHQPNAASGGHLVSSASRRLAPGEDAELVVVQAVAERAEALVLRVVIGTS